MKNQNLKTKTALMFMLKVENIVKLFVSCIIKYNEFQYLFETFLYKCIIPDQSLSLFLNYK